MTSRREIEEKRYFTTRQKIWMLLSYWLPHQNVTVQASCPGLYVDKKGVYWDVPLSLSADLASVGSSSGLSYHLFLQQNSGEPKYFGGDETSEVPIALLPSLCVKAAVSIKKSIDAWRKKEDKLKKCSAI